MHTRWELVVALARQLDEEAARGELPNPTRVARLARAVLEFQSQLTGGPGIAATRPSTPPSTNGSSTG